MSQTSERAEPSERAEQIWSGWSKFGVGGQIWSGWSKFGAGGMDWAEQCEE